jgi:hypothetical protein
MLVIPHVPVPCSPSSTRLCLRERRLCVVAKRALGVPRLVCSCFRAPLLRARSRRRYGYRNPFGGGTLRAAGCLACALVRRAARCRSLTGAYRKSAQAFHGPLPPRMRARSPHAPPAPARAPLRISLPRLRLPPQPPPAAAPPPSAARSAPELPSTAARPAGWRPPGGTAPAGGAGKHSVGP